MNSLRQRGSRHSTEYSYKPLIRSRDRNDADLRHPIELVSTEPVAISAVLTEEPLAIERIGLEAGPLSQWLYSALAEAGLPVICVETRHMKAALSGTNQQERPQ